MNTIIHKSTTLPYPLNKMAGVNKIISYNWDINPEELGIAMEIVEKVYDNYNELKVKYIPVTNDRFKVACVLPEEDIHTEWEYVLRIISLFNQVPSVEFNVYGSDKYNHILRNYANDHIIFLTKKDGEMSEETILANLILTYGPGSIHFIKQGIPVLIAGPYGMGGWVTQDNIFFLLRDAFMGRPGGMMNEPILPVIFIHELLCISECKNINEMLLLNQEFVYKLPYKSISELEKIIEQETALSLQLVHPEKRWQLHPRLASNILFEQDKEEVVLKRKYINDTICTLSKEDMPFFDKVKDGVNCEVLCKDLEMNENDFWDTITSLIDSKIILF